jgi:hypothetical protein
VACLRSLDFCRISTRPCDAADAAVFLAVAVFVVEKVTFNDYCCCCCYCADYNNQICGQRETRVLRCVLPLIIPPIGPRNATERQEPSSR